MGGVVGGCWWVVSLVGVGGWCAFVSVGGVCGGC
jgi:hypothetical protein